MTTRTHTLKKIDPVVIARHALRHIKNKGDYNRIQTANKPEDFEAAWQSLDAEAQERITAICGSAPQPDINGIASEITACGTYLELQAIKAEYGKDTVKAAWLTIPIPERDRIKALCHNVQKAEESTPMTEQPQHLDSSEIPKTYPENLRKVDSWLQKEKLTESTPPKTRSIFCISGDIEKLNDLLDENSDDAEQQQLIAQWFETLGDERDRKLDGYAALISEMLARAEVRKAEAKRLTELAASDEDRAKLLKNRLKTFFETHNLKSVNTVRYRLLVATNGGKQPLIIDESVPVTQMPEQFQKVSIDPDTAAIRDALERGEKLGFAQLGERGTSLRIK